MRNVRSVIFGLGCLLGGAFLANYFGADIGAQDDIGAQEQTVERWAAADCSNISGSSGLFLAVSGGLLEEADRLTNEGSEAEATESYEGGLAFSELAANFARNFEAYCK